MTGSKNKARAQAKLEKRASAHAKAVAEREAANAGKGSGKNRDKAKGKVGNKTDAVAEMKAGSKNKAAAEMKEGARSESKAVGKATSDFSHKAENKVARSTRKEKPGSDTWFWAGEDSGLNSWFWKGEEVSNTVAKSENKTNTCTQAHAEESEPTPRTSHKSRSGAEEEEEENVIGNWFWEGDDTGFDSDPKPVFRIVKPQPVDEINEKNRPKDWSEVTIWPKAPAVTPAVLGYRSQDSSEARPSSFIVLASNEEEASAACTKNTRSSLQPIPEYPFGSDPCIQTLDGIRQQIKVREENGIKPFACPCKMECYLDSPEFEKLVNILKSTTDPLIHKIAQIAMGIHKVHPFAQEFINEVGVVTLIESLLSFSSSESIKKTVITLNSSVNDRQHKVEFHVKHMCKETVSFPLNSPGQQSGLKIIGQLTTESVHHYIVVSYFSELFHLLSQGNRKTRNLVLKVFLNMSENPKAARDMINMKALAALKLIFNQKEAKANLVSAVAIFINIKEHIRKGSIVVVDHLSYSTLTAIFREVKGIIERM
ncbi:G protein-coupled receptor associated sorting protein 3 [Meriones unguiculatus]|uniref:G protein-coupled receptor associated sorting protein 3 n=1 Tax=Meriones unguiculatus TaxID=10047 RepID=UPI000B4F26BB|nr:G protein-coupled receptor associated sorting protein 3 [Meriones unguiculatus]